MQADFLRLVTIGSQSGQEYAMWWPFSKKQSRRIRREGRAILIFKIEISSDFLDSLDDRFSSDAEIFEHLRQLIANDCLTHQNAVRASQARALIRATTDTVIHSAGVIS